MKEAEYDLLCNLGQLFAAQPQRVLDFDIENRPLSYWYDGNCTAEITAIAASFGPREGIRVWLLGIDEPVEILERFREMYDEADVVRVTTFASTTFLSSTARCWNTGLARWARS